jgi:hypothetical protein
MSGYYNKAQIDAIATLIGDRIKAASSGGGGDVTWVLRTSNVTATAPSAVIADTSGGAWTLTLPASPSIGDYVQLLDGADWSANNLTVARNGETIDGDAADLVMNIGNIAVDLIYDGTTWQIAAQVGAQGGAQGGSDSFVSSPIAQVRNASAISDLNGTTDWADVAITGLIDFMDAGFRAGSTGIICDFDGRIEVKVHILQNNSTNARTNVKTRAANGAAVSPIEGAGGYIRDSDNNDESSGQAGEKMSVVDGNEITLQTIREAASGAVVGPAGSCMISIMRI